MEGIDPGVSAATVMMFAWKFRAKPRKNIRAVTVKL
jgi:hypothetical protein